METCRHAQTCRHVDMETCRSIQDVKEECAIAGEQNRKSSLLSQSTERAESQPKAATEEAVDYDVSDAEDEVRDASSKPLVENHNPNSKIDQSESSPASQKTSVFSASSQASLSQVGEPCPGPDTAATTIENQLAEKFDLTLGEIESPPNSRQSCPTIISSVVQVNKSRQLRMFTLHQVRGAPIDI